MPYRLRDCRQQIPSQPLTNEGLRLVVPAVILHLKSQN